MLRFREYGPPGATRTVVVLHGGPGAPRSAGSLANLLATPARVLEPWQTAHSVAGHLSDLHAFLLAHCPHNPILVGHSWGAMLALAFAAAYPRSTAAICAVSSGTFDVASRAAFKASLDQRLPPRSAQLTRAERFALTDALYVVDPLPPDALDRTQLDEPANEASWNDMLALQANGTYPAAFAQITVPVLMVHGADDPHPGAMIRASLAPFVQQLEYRELASCGHYPWQERRARAELLQLMRDWIAVT